LAILKIVAVAAPLALLLGGCAYDYLQHTDRVAYGTGDAVQANLEAQTIDPANPDSYLTGGLGKDGDVTPSTPVPEPAP
jgi:hypothetical protein